MVASPLQTRRRTSAARALAMALSIVLATASSAAYADAQNSAAKGAFRPSAELDLRALDQMVRVHAPGLEAASLELDLAAAEVKKSHLLLNPTLDIGWGTIPIGSTNPPGLAAPMANVPNYGVGLSYTFLLGKRGPLQDRAAALEYAARAGLDNAARVQALGLAHGLGLLATTMLRSAGLRRLAEDGKQQVAIAEARVSAQFAPGLELDRLKVEASRLEQAARSAESDVSVAVSSCSALLGAPCEPFASPEEARHFLVRWIERAAPTDALSNIAIVAIEQRPDVRALAAYGKAAEAEARFARALAIPDPTVRVGYVRDQFVVAGNQLNSLNVSVSIPLPIFDHGQAELAAAQARRARAEAQRQKTIEASRSRLPALRQRLEAQKKRQQVLAGEILPRAERTLHDLSRAAEGRLVPLTDVIQARRMVSELLIEEADSFGDAFDASLEIAAELVKTSEKKP